MVGVPDEPAELRGVVWLLLLGLLPEERAQWPDAMAQLTNLYHQLVFSLIYSDYGGFQRRSPTPPPESRCALGAQRVVEGNTCIRV